MTSCTKTRLKVCQGVDSRESRAFGLTAGDRHKRLFPGERQKMQGIRYMSRQITCDLLSAKVRHLRMTNKPWEVDWRNCLQASTVSMPTTY